MTAFVLQKSAAPSAALRHRGCTIEVPGSCFPAIAGTGPRCEIGAAETPGTSDARYYTNTTPKLRVFVGKTRSNTSFCIVPFAGPNKKLKNGT
jgi:hypothetical protein